MMIDEPKGKINLVKAGPGKCWSPVEPVLVLNGSTLSWKEEENMKYYLHSNFSEEDKLVTSPYDLIGAPDGFYSVYAVDEKDLHRICPMRLFILLGNRFVKRSRALIQERFLIFTKDFRGVALLSICLHVRLM